MYKRNAEELSTALRSSYPDLEFEFNKTKPRKKSFEFTLLKEDGNVVLWSGIDKGPPRKMKFPSSDELFDAFKKATVDED